MRQAEGASREPLERTVLGEPLALRPTEGSAAAFEVVLALGGRDCETDVLEGTPDYRDSALGEE
ncbi:hypothetical protein AB0D11_23715 [Streptomyces monashensis]|uniref:hypothetical protein n=1 Tax=Streptomyces monashensis TaxID=1678012 RepID=UPI0033DC888A